MAEPAVGIVIATLERESGGPAAFVKSVANALVAQHVQTTIMAYTAGSSGLHAGVDLIGTRRPRGPFGRVPRLDRSLDALVNRSEVLMIHGLWQHSSHRAMHHAQRAGLPYVVFPHGMLDPYIVGRTRLHRIVRPVQTKAFLRRDLARASAVAFTTQAELRKASSVGISSGTTLRYGTQDFGSPRICARGRRRVSVIYVGRLHPKKNLLALVESLALLGDLEVELILVGPESAYQLEVEGQVQSLGLTSQVRFVGPLYGDSLAEALRQADWLALVSWQENFGQVITQALSVGTPVVLGSTLDLAGEFRPDDPSVVVTDIDPSSIAVALKEAAFRTRGPTYESIRSHARDLYESRFQFESAVADYLELARTAVRLHG